MQSPIPKSETVSPLIGSYDTSGIAVGVTVSGDYAYIADFDNGLQIINISNPAHPVLAGAYNTDGVAYAVAVSGDYAYIADYWSGMPMLDITTPSSSTLTSNLPSYTAVGVAVEGNYAYLARGEYGIEIRNISRPSTQLSVKSFDTPGYASGIAISGDYAYVADGSNGLEIINISNASNPLSVGALVTSDAQSVAVSGDYAYVADGSGGLRVINVSDPSHPLLADTVDTPGIASGVAVNGNTVYIADGSRGLQIINISDPAQATLFNTIDTPSSASGVAVNGNYAYVADGAGGLQVIQLLSNATPTGTVTINDITPEQNQQLIVTNTLADADGLGAISYSWLASGINVGEGDSYTVTANEVGKTIAVIASYTDGLGNPESVSSAMTSAVTVPVTAGFSISPIVDQVTGEDGTTASYNISLKTAPLANQNVELTFASSDTSEGIIDNPVLTFTSANWSVPQTLTVRGVDDYLGDGNVPYQVIAKITSIDVSYKALTLDPFNLTNTDDGLDKALDKYGDEGGSKIDILNGGNGADKLHGLNMADNLSGGLGNDSLWGGYGDDNLFGNEGDDKLLGEQENDYLDGGAGNDTLDGGDGVDTMIGGAGNDTYYLGYDAADVITDNGLKTDVDTVIMPYQLTSYTLPTGIEKGTIAAGTGTSSLLGNGSNNALTGNDGINNLSGAVGRDSLFGGLGDDVLNGGTGNDVLEGGMGKDDLTGGAGKDSFVFNSMLKANVDKLTDFKPIDDTIQLENTIFTKLTTIGVLNADNFVMAATAIDSNDYLVYNKSTGALFYDVDGSSSAGVGIQIAVLGVDLALTNTDFVVI